MFVTRHSTRFRPEDWSDVRLGKPDGSIIVKIAGCALQTYLLFDDDEPLLGNDTGRLPASLVRVMAAMYVNQEVAKGTPVPDDIHQQALEVLNESGH